MIIFELPSNQKAVEFTEPTVKTAKEMARFQDEKTELATTYYLDQLQKGTDTSADWTIEDRRAALLMIYFNTTTEKPIRKFNYECEHCGETHKFDVDFLELVNTYKILDKDVRDGVQIKYKDIEYTVKPLTGKAAQEIESRYLIAKAENSREILSSVVVYQISQYLGLSEDDIEGWTMDKYETISSQIHESLKRLEHGVSVMYKHDCPVKEGANTQIELPFQSSHFISRIF